MGIVCNHARKMPSWIDHSFKNKCKKACKIIIWRFSRQKEKFHPSNPGLYEGIVQIFFMPHLSSFLKWLLCSSGLQFLACYIGLRFGCIFFKNLDKAFLNIPNGLVLLFFECVLPWTAQLGLMSSQQTSGPSPSVWSETAAVCFSINLYLLWFWWVSWHSFQWRGSFLGTDPRKR